MPTSPPPPSTTVYLTATYTSPTTPTPQTLTSSPLHLPHASDKTTTSKTNYLRALRAATTDLQDRINAELTARMEEDNRKAAELQEQQREGTVDGAPDKKNNKKGKKGKGKENTAIDEEAEEENYGEEVAEEED